jgi:hypothetical protein
MDDRRENGYALVTALMLLALLMTLVVGYYTMTRVELSTTRSSMDSFRGFYAAEAGLNLRADQIRQIFVGYNRPAGTSPDPEGAQALCTVGNSGSDDFACLSYQFQSRDVTTYLEESAGNPVSIVIPRGELYQNLHAQEYQYSVHSAATGHQDRLEALLEMQFKSRLVPMFQFAVFYNKDLEILPGPDMTLAGPVHTNGDLYLGCHNTLDVLGQVTTARDLYRGRKNEDICMTGPVQVADPENQTEIPTCAGGRQLLDQAELDAWNGMIQTHVDVLTVPPPEVLDPTPGQIYWDKADVRLMLDLDQSPPAIEVRNPDGSPNVLDTGALAGCGAVSHSNSMFNNREGSAIEMLDVDIEALLDCAHTTGLMGGKPLNDASEGGLVWYFGVDGPDAGGLNNYGVRVLNGERLASSVVGAPQVRGLTVVTNQAIYVQGDYNATDKKPAAFLADSLNVLSNDWQDANSTLHLDNRVAATTTINAAMLAGTDVTGGAEGPAGQDRDEYNGGVENYPRFHEKWDGRTLRYRGSFVSLYEPLRVDGAWEYGDPQYTAPNRDWGYDSDFDDAANLPPLSPRFVYLRQELFVRQFEM